MGRLMGEGDGDLSWSRRLSLSHLFFPVGEAINASKGDRGGHAVRFLSGEILARGDSRTTTMVGNARRCQAEGIAMRYCYDMIHVMRCLTGGRRQAFNAKPAQLNSHCLSHCLDPANTTWSRLTRCTLAKATLALTLL